MGVSLFGILLASKGAYAAVLAIAALGHVIKGDDCDLPRGLLASLTRRGRGNIPLRPLVLVDASADEAIARLPVRTKARLEFYDRTGSTSSARPSADLVAEALELMIVPSIGEPSISIASAAEATRIYDTRAQVYVAALAAFARQHETASSQGAASWLTETLSQVSQSVVATENKWTRRLERVDTESLAGILGFEGVPAALKS